MKGANFRTWYVINLCSLEICVVYMYSRCYHVFWNIKYFLGILWFLFGETKSILHTPMNIDNCLINFWIFCRTTPGDCFWNKVHKSMQSKPHVICTFFATCQSKTAIWRHIAYINTLKKQDDSGGKTRCILLETN